MEGTNTYKADAHTVSGGDGTIIHEVEAVTPILCEPGFYCLSGTATPANESVRYDVTTPQLCPAGFWCGEGSCSPTGYGPCSPGEFCPEGSSAPNVTRPGYYTEFYALSTEWICLPGTYGNSSNLDYCDICPPGAECLTDGVVTPKLCDAGIVMEDI